jgi:hypothetical protein
VPVSLCDFADDTSQDRISHGRIEYVLD